MSDKKHTSIRLTARTLVLLAEICQREGRSRNNAIEHAIRQYAVAGKSKDTDTTSTRKP